MSKPIASVIREKGFCMITPKGYSMYPMLKQGRNQVCVVRAEQPLELYDVALYIRSDGTHVLHRVIGFEENSYIMCGDNQWEPEHGITPEMVIGRLDSWYKGKKEYKTDGKRYLRYVRFWCKSLKRRRRILKIRRAFCEIGWFFKGVFGKIARILRIKK